MSRAMSEKWKHFGIALACISCMTVHSITALVPHGDQDHRKDTSSDPALFGGDGVGFDDLIDMVNPLHHLPVVSHVYRAATGDQISAAAQIVGGGIFGGAIGAASGAATAIAEGITGDSLINTALGLFDTENDAEEGTVQLFAAQRGTALVANEISTASFVAMQQAEHLAREEALAAQAAPAQEQQTTSALDLAAARDPAMGLTDSNKQQQLKSSLHETLLQIS